MSQEKQTSYDIYKKHYTIYLDNMMEIGYTERNAVTNAMEEYATLKLQEKDKYISKLEETIKTYESGSATIEKQLQEQAKEIERLKSEALFNAITVLPEKDAEIERLKGELSQIDEPLLQLLDEINHMRKLYANSKYGKSEEVMNEITHKLDDIRRIEPKPIN